MAELTTLDGVKMIALAYCSKYDNDKRVKYKKANFLSYYWKQTMSPHFQVSQQRRNKIIQMGKELNQSLSTIASLYKNTMMVCQLLI